MRQTTVRNRWKVASPLGSVSDDESYRSFYPRLLGAVIALDLLVFWRGTIRCE